MNTRAHTSRMIGFGLLYAVFVIGSAFWANDNPNSQLRYAMALVPMIPALMMLISFTDHLRSLDELQRDIQLYGIAFSFGATALSTLSFGFLQAFAKLEAPSWIWIWPLMGMYWILGSWLASRKYQ